MFIWDKVLVANRYEQGEPRDCLEAMKKNIFPFWEEQLTLFQPVTFSLRWLRYHGRNLKAHNLDDQWCPDIHTKFYKN